MRPPLQHPGSLVKSFCKVSNGKLEENHSFMLYFGLLECFVDISKRCCKLFSKVKYQTFEFLYEKSLGNIQINECYSAKRTEYFSVKRKSTGTTPSSHSVLQQPHAFSVLLTRSITTIISPPYRHHPQAGPSHLITLNVRKSQTRNNIQANRKVTFPSASTKDAQRNGTIHYLAIMSIENNSRMFSWALSP